MFTGIIQKLGVVKQVDEHTDSKSLLILATDNFFEQITKGASVAVNGVCLTAEHNAIDWIKVTAVNQTLETTALSECRPGDRVNLELPAKADSFLGGHIVMGHIDGVAEVAKIVPLEIGREIWFNIEPKFHRYIIDKGSITLDGASMTVAKKTESGIRVAVIPETLANTRFGLYQPGTKVNFEVDIIGKYLENFVNQKQ